MTVAYPEFRLVLTPRAFDPTRAQAVGPFASLEAAAVARAEEIRRGADPTEVSIERREVIVSSWTRHVEEVSE